MEEDLIIGKPVEGEEEEYELEDIDLHSEIASAYNALAAVADMDEKLLSKEKQRMIRTIKRKSLEIIHRNINDLHSEIFGREEETEEEN